MSPELSAVTRTAVISRKYWPSEWDPPGHRIRFSNVAAPTADRAKTDPDQRPELKFLRMGIAGLEYDAAAWVLSQFLLSGRVERCPLRVRQGFTLLPQPIRNKGAA